MIARPCKWRDCGGIVIRDVPWDAALHAILRERGYRHQPAAPRSMTLSDRIALGHEPEWSLEIPKDQARLLSELKWAAEIGCEIEMGRRMSAATFLATLRSVEKK